MSSYDVWFFSESFFWNNLLKSGKIQQMNVNNNFLIVLVFFWAAAVVVQMFDHDISAYYYIIKLVRCNFKITYNMQCVSETMSVKMKVEKHLLSVGIGTLFFRNFTFFLFLDLSFHVPFSRFVKLNLKKLVASYVLSSCTTIIQHKGNYEIFRCKNVNQL